MPKMSHEDKATIDSQEHQQRTETLADTKARQSHEAVEPCLCLAEEKYTLLTYSNVSIFSRGAVLRPSLAVSFAKLESASGTAAVIYLLMNIQNVNFNAKVFIIQVRSRASCQKLSN